MLLLTRLSAFLENLFFKKRRDRELTEEIDAYLELLVEAKVKEGLAPADARRAAFIELGGKEQIKEEVRDVRFGQYLEALLQDLRYGIRILHRNPAFAAIAILTLTLGIGANAAIFSIVHGVLLQPLPYGNDDRLVSIIQSYPQKGLVTWGLSQANFALYRDHNQVFEKIAAYNSPGFNLTGGTTPERIQGTAVTGDFFEVLGVQPGWGRAFRPEEDVQGKNSVCILSYGLWQRRFGGDPEILGQSLVLNDTPTQVVGVMPRGFSFPNRNVELWIPLGLNPQRMFGYSLRGIALLKPGVSVSQAQAETTNIFWGAAQENPAMAGVNTPPPEGADMKTIVRPRKDVIVGETRAPLLVLLGAVGFVLLIACANVANLLLARAASRTREITLRLALGATPRRIIRQLLTESVMLSLIGGAAGVALAWLVVRLLRQLPELQQVPRLAEVNINSSVLGFTAGLALLTGLLFGLAPALRAYKLGLSEGMREGMRGSASRGSRRLNSALVAGQFALCLVLLIGAGLLLKSFQQLLSVSPGFQTENVLSMRLALPANKYQDPPQTVQFFDNLLERVRSLPAIRSASVVSLLPFSGGGTSDGYIIEGHEPQSTGLAPNAQNRVVSPDYFQTLQIPLLRGRDFGPADRADSPPVVVVDETLARRYWQDGDAIGKRIRYSWSDQWMTIVGVAGGIKNRNLIEEVAPHFYEPYAQTQSREMYLTLRTVNDPSSVVTAIQSEVQSLDPDLPVWGVQLLTQAVDQTLNNQRVTNGLLTVFAVLALLLAAIGIYGVMSLYVSHRTTEFGIRLALGAQPLALLRSVLRQGLTVTSVGILVGTAAAFALTRTLTTLLFQVSATDITVFVSVPVLLVAVALVACYTPAWRATRVDPLVALRYE